MKQITDDRSAEKRGLLTVRTVLLIAGMVVVLVILGFVGRLFGCPPREFVFNGIALAISIILLTCCNHKGVQSTLRVAQQVAESRYRWLRSSRALSAAIIEVVLLLTILSGLVWAGTSSMVGTTPKDEPVFVHKAVYTLNQSGELTPVSELRYRIVGLSFAVGWSCLPIVFVALAVHLALFGEWAIGGVGKSEDGGRGP
jgi:cytochrome c biogenesis protein CcdA